MFGFLALLIVIPIIELYVMVQVAGQIGVVPTVLAVVALCVAGAWLMKVQGLGVLRRMQAQFAAGEMPAGEVVNGVLVLVGGMLMLVPGFVTGAVGLLLLLPPVRALLRPLVLSWAQRRIDQGRSRFVVFAGGTTDLAGGSFGGRVYDVDSVSDDGPPPTGPEDRPGGRELGS